MVKKPAQPAHTAQNGTGSAQPSDASVNVSDQVARERVQMLVERQAELDGVLGRHDDMVREVFHLEQFVTLLDYDPKVAKQDDSVVFQEYKTKYDLIERAAAAAGPSRATRRAHTQRVLDLTVSSPIKNAPGASAKTDVRRVPPHASQTTTVLSSKAKGKQKAVEPPMEDASVSISAPNGTTKARPRPRVLAAHQPEPEPPSISASQTLKRTSTLVSSPPSSPIVKKKRKSAVGLDESRSGTLQPRRSGRLEGPSKPPEPRLTAHPSTNSLSHGPDELPSISRTSSIRRVRLIVRKPPPSYTNPRQKPPPPKFTSNLTDFLSSYTSLDEQELTPETLETLAQNEAVLREKLDGLHKQGRFVPFMYGESFKGLVAGKGSPAPVLSITANPNARDPRRSKDMWEHIVETIVHRGRHSGGGSGFLIRGRHIAAQVANRIQAYWDQSVVREDRARVQEEKRLRALAKAMVKMVVAEWKKAVFYIREQERQRAEAEEMRRGHEHLDAILDQSGQILETQQVDLSRGDLSRSRSRSSSLSATHWEQESTGTSEGDEEHDGEENEHEEEGSGAESAEEFAGVGMLEDADHDHYADAGEDGDGRGQDESEEETSEDDNDEMTHALLGPTHRRDDVVPTSPPPDRADADAVMEPEVRSPSEFSTDQDAATLANRPMMFEDAVASPSVPSDMDSIVRTPTLGEARSPALDSFYDYPMQDAPSPASSVNDHDLVKDGDVPIVVINGRAVNGSKKVVDDVQLDMVDVRENSAEDEDASQPPPERVFDGAVSIKVQHAEVAVEVDAPMEDVHDDDDEFARIPEYLNPFAVAPVDWSPEDKIKPPLLLRGVLRPYQQSGLEWLTSLHSNNLNGILADEMGLGKTIQTIALLAHLACDRGIWGPHLIIVPTSVLLNWEMEFKKFLPGFRILSYHGSTKRRKELRQGWYNKHHFNVCITSYTLASRDAHIFKRKMWYYMILDEAHMIKNFRSQRWNILLMFRSFRRLLLTGTPLQNNLTELWALLQFLMSGTNFANLKEFGEWFSNPLEKAIEMGTMLDDENLQRVSKLHTVLRPYLLRRLKRDVEKELPSKYEHLVLCPLSKRQRFLYDEFMSRAHTREALESGVYQKIANVLMQLRKVCNHPDLFEVRPVVTSFAMTRSAIADFEIKELLVRRELLKVEDEERVNLDLFGLRFVDKQAMPLVSALETRRLDATHRLPLISEMPGGPPPKDMRTVAGYRTWRRYQQRVQKVARWAQIGYVNHLRCARTPIYGQELLRTVQGCYQPILPLPAVNLKAAYLDTVTTKNAMVKSYEQRTEDMSGLIDRFAFATPPVVTLDLARVALSGYEEAIMSCSPRFDEVLHRSSVKLQVAFPDPSLLQYDCGKLQELSRLLRQKKAEGHRILIFTQMTRVLDILETFLNFHGYLYLRLDGATKIEDRQYITERFNADARVFCFISSSRSGGVGINLTGADTVIFYDSDFNPQMDRQCEDRAHRIGQIRDVHIYRFISSHTVEEAMLMKANQKRSLDDIVIQKGAFDWRTLFEDDGALTKALGEFEDSEDAQAAVIAAREEDVLEGADKADFGAEEMMEARVETEGGMRMEEGEEGEQDHGGEEGEGGSVSDYMIRVVRTGWDFFRDWRL
ncbi:SNF2 family N-terminal domain-containing protein [Boletus edulis BED1]|uniref:Helicase SWR1 n=1 Tax=Boletus edulis BED1 TaxID=1328754 RepID=A0AAD4BN90_BOLED|nr:SNF2 family N-terminal domain-containing protein [Boletus edulis BED1]